MTALSPDDEMPSAELAPRRLLEGGAGEHERSLLASARLDRVPRSAKARVAAALGGVLELQATPNEPEPAAPARSATRSGLGVVGAGVVGAIALSLWLQATPETAPSASSIPAASTPAVSAPRGPALHPPFEGPPAASPAHLARAPQSVPPRSDRSGPSKPKPSASTPPGESLGLLAEVRALEAVSSAIGAGQLSRAARELDAYRQRFARGELAVEADVLAIELAVARGDHAAASAGAERLLARPEAEHYRARVRALIAPPDRENARRDRSNGPAGNIRARR